MKDNKSKFPFLTSRTFWVSLALLCIVVGLFFIPEIIKFQMSSRTNDGKTAAQHRPTVAPSAQTPSPEQAEKSLDAISDELASNDTTRPGRPLGDAGASSSEGFSGWSFKLRDGGKSVSADAMTLNNLDSRDSQNFFKKARTDVGKVIEAAKVRELSAKEALYNFAATLELIGNGGAKSLDQRVLREQLISQYALATERMSTAGADRGALMQWRDLPISKLMVRYTRGGVGIGQMLFKPGIFLRSVTIRQPVVRPGERMRPAQLTAEVAIRGDDVESISIFTQGNKQRDVKPGKAGADGFRSFKMSGSADGLWTLVAYDKYGSQPFRKIYSFYPRVRRFRQKRDGTYDIAFIPGSPAGSLDRYFTVGYSKREYHDPSVSIF